MFITFTTITGVQSINLRLFQSSSFTGKSPVIYRYTLLRCKPLPTAPVTDYRTCVSGVKLGNLSTGKDFSTVQRQVKSLIDRSDCIIIGHSLHFDLDALDLTHPEHRRRDLAKYEPFLRMNNGQPASLQFLAKRYLGKTIQQGEHDSVEDAKAAMDIYRAVSSQWERNY